MKELMKRLKQESTWRGVIAILSAFGVVIEPEMAEAVIAAGLGLIGVINVVKKD